MMMSPRGRLCQDIDGAWNWEQSGGSPCRSFPCLSGDDVVFSSKINENGSPMQVSIPRHGFSMGKQVLGEGHGDQQQWIVSLRIRQALGSSGQHG